MEYIEHERTFGYILYRLHTHCFPTWNMADLSSHNSSQHIYIQWTSAQYQNSRAHCEGSIAVLQLMEFLLQQLLEERTLCLLKLISPSLGILKGLQALRHLRDDLRLSSPLNWKHV